MMEGIITAMTTAFGTVSTNVMDIVEVAIPVALGLLATMLAIRIGIKFFKKTTSSAG